MRSRRTSKKTNDLKTEKGKLNNLSKLRLEILKYQDAASFYKAPLKRHLRLTLDKIRLQEFTYQGKRFAHAGQVDKSVKLFEKALDQIYHDDVDDKYQQKEIAIIKRAIKKTGAAPRGESKRFVMSARWPKLAIPLLLVLALLPTSALAEGGAATAGGGTTKADTGKVYKHNMYEAPNTIYPDGRMEYGDGRIEYPDGRVVAPDGTVLRDSRKEQKPSSFPDGMPSVSSGGPLSETELLRMLKEDREREPWYKSTLQSLKTTIAPQFVTQLPLPENLGDVIENSRMMYENGYYSNGIILPLKDIELRWKYIGQKKVKNVLKHVWVSAVQAKGSTSLDFRYSIVQSCDNYRLFTYGKLKDGTFSGAFKANGWSGGGNDGDTTYLEFHALDENCAPEKDTIKFSEYTFTIAKEKFIPDEPQSFKKDGINPPDSKLQVDLRKDTVVKLVMKDINKKPPRGDVYGTGTLINNHGVDGTYNTEGYYRGEMPYDEYASSAS